MTPKKKRPALHRWLWRKNRVLFFSFSIVLAGLLIIQATYAWETYGSTRENKMGNAHLQVTLKEDFAPNNEWEPGQTTRKKVYVANEGNYAAFVRLSVEEFLLTFDMDIAGQGDAEGTGNVLEITPLPPIRSISKADVTTWQKGAFYQKTPSSAAYQGKATLPNPIPSNGKGLVYEKDKSVRQSSDLSYLTLEFGDVIDYDNTLTGAYWQYGGDGYYYYSKRLDPGKQSRIFLKEVSLSASTPNRLKEALYQLDVVMEGDYAIAETLGKWGHDGPTDPIYQLLKNQLLSNP